MRDDRPEDDRSVLLTGFTGDGGQLLVLPLATAQAELTTSAVLLGAETFADARQDAGAADLVECWSPVYLETLRAAGVDAEMDEDTFAVERTWSGAPFDAEDFFADNPCWRPDPRRSTLEWLATTEPDLLDVFTASDLPCDDEPVPWSAAAALPPLERLLTRLGYQVRRCPRLQAAYEEPATFLADLLSAEVVSTAVDRPVVLTDLSIDGLQVLAVPRDTARAELRTAALLATASTFGEVRQDAEAAWLVEQHLEEYRDHLSDSPELTDLVDEAVEQRLDELTGDDAPFDVESVFSADDQLEWQAYAEVRRSTADWLAHAEPTLLERYGSCDEGDGPMYERAAWIAADDRAALERGLVALGYVVEHFDGLEQLYLDPPLEVDELLRGEPS